MSMPGVEALPIMPALGDFKFKAHLGNLMGCSLKIKSKHGAGDIAQLVKCSVYSHKT